MPAGLSGEGQLVQAGDLPLTLHAGRMVSRQVADQLADPLAELEGEVRGGGAHELAHIVHRDLAVGAEAIGMLGFAHFWGTASNRLSTSACTEVDTACWLPMIQAWL